MGAPSADMQHIKRLQVPYFRAGTLAEGLGIHLIQEQLIIPGLCLTTLPGGSQRNLPMSLTCIQLGLEALCVLMSSSRDTAIPTE